MASPAIQSRHRPDLANRVLIALLVATLAGIVVCFAARPFLPPAFQQPGTALLQSAAILGTVFLLVPLAFTIAKRSGRSEMPNRWFIAHVVASLAGILLVAVHTTGALDRPPALLLLVLLALALSGAVARVRLSRNMAATLGTKARAFAEPDPALKTELRGLIGQKTALLAKLDPGVSEATFSVTLRHWLTSPWRALAYSRLAAKESSLIGARQSVSFAQGYWRPMHMALSWVFIAGLVVHVVVVTFFAGWAAEGRDIYWWHLAAW